MPYMSKASRSNQLAAVVDPGGRREWLRARRSKRLSPDALVLGWRRAGGRTTSKRLARCGQSDTAQIDQDLEMREPRHRRCRCVITFGTVAGGSVPRVRSPQGCRRAHHRAGSRGGNNLARRAERIAHVQRSASMPVRRIFRCGGRMRIDRCVSAGGRDGQEHRCRPL